jgi:ArsR family transcriptional regulator
LSADVLLRQIVLKHHESFPFIAVWVLHPRLILGRVATIGFHLVAGNQANFCPLLPINVKSVEQSLDFYKKLFGIEPSKVRKGYAKFDVQNPLLNFTLNEVPFGEPGALSHMGIQVSSTEDVLKIRPMGKKALNPEELFRALADETRLRILHLIGDQEVCVCYFVEALDVGQPKISRHLAYLRKVGLVETRRDGKWIHYRLAQLKDVKAERMLKAAIAWTHELSQAKKDLARFEVACCQPQNFVTLQGAPVPTPVG